MADDVDFTEWVSIWFYEETKHPDALLRWLGSFGVTVDALSKTMLLVVTGVAVSASLRAQDSRRDGNEAAFVGFSAISVLSVLGVLAAVGGGIWVMAQ